MVAFAGMVGLQVLIAATGNYGFFNLLTIVLCLSLVEDRDWGRAGGDEPAPPPRRSRCRAAFGAAWLITVAVKAMEALDRSGLSTWTRFPDNSA